MAVKEKKTTKIAIHRELDKLSQISNTLKDIAKLEKRKSGVKRTSVESVQVLSTLALHSIAAIKNVVKYEETRKLALVDDLTGANNFRYFKERLKEEFERAKRHRFNLCLLFLDIDGFKKFNDIYGHLAGNKVLKDYVKVLRENVRSIDIIFRYGGDEFAILLPQTDLVGAEITAQRIQKAIANYYQRKKHKLSALSVSIGLAEFREKMKSTQALVSHVDKALYRAKSKGRGNISK